MIKDNGEESDTATLSPMRMSGHQMMTITEKNITFI